MINAIPILAGLLSIVFALRARYMERSNEKPAQAEKAGNRSDVRGVKNMALLKILSVKTYGDNLLTPGAANWLVASRVVILVACLIQGLCWAYIAALMVDHRFSYFAAVLTGIVIFLFIWALDATFLSLDNASRIYEEKIFSNNPDQYADSKMFAFFRKYSSKIGMTIRLIMLEFSVAIIAPFVSSFLHTLPLPYFLGNTEIDAIVLLSFLALSVFLFKVFAPKSVEIYLSERLQQAYLKYKTGGFDDLLPENERYSGSSPMNAYRFEEFILTTYRKSINQKRHADLDYEFENKKYRIQRAIDNHYAERKSVIEATDSKINELKERLRLLQARAVDTENSLDFIRNNIEKLTNEINGYKTQIGEIKEINRQIEAEIKDERVNAIIDHFISVQRKSEAANAALNEEQRLYNNITTRIERLTIERQLVEREIEIAERPLKNWDLTMEKFKQEEQELYLQYIKGEAFVE